ncbi:MAG: hypothetical protein VB957_01420 [Pseudomonadales bacterium]
MRVNRLIIESVIDDSEILQRGQYLSTSGVIDSALDHYAADDHEIENIDAG